MGQSEGGQRSDPGRTGLALVTAFLAVISSVSVALVGYMQSKHKDQVVRLERELTDARERDKMALDVSSKLLSVNEQERAAALLKLRILYRNDEESLEEIESRARELLIQDTLENLCPAYAAICLDPRGDGSGVWKEALQKYLPPPSGPTALVVDYIPVLDGVTKIAVPEDEWSQYEASIATAIAQASTSHAQLTVTDRPSNNEERRVTDRFSQISFDPNLTPAQKFTAISEELMKPKGSNILISAMVIDTGTVVQLRPLLVSTIDETIRSKSLSYETYEEFMCGDSLCSTVESDLARAIGDLLDEYV